MIKNIKKIATIGAVVGVTGLMLGGCASVTQEQLNAAMENANTWQMKANTLEANNAQLAKSLDGLNTKVNTLGDDLESTKKENERLNQVLLDAQQTENEVVEAAAKDYISKYSKEFDLDEELDNVELHNGNLKALVDGKIRFRGDNYDIRETINLDGVSLGLSGEDLDNEELGDTAHLLLQSGEATYTLEFMDPIDIDDIDAEHPLNVKFAGKQLHITNVDDNSITAQYGEEYNMLEGELVDTPAGKVELRSVNLDSDEVLLFVDGKSVRIALDDVKDVGDYQIAVNEIFGTSKESQKSYAAIVVGEKAMETYDNDDEWNDLFNVQVNVEDGMLQDIKLVLDEDLVDVRDEFTPIKAGEARELIADWFTLGLEQSKESYNKYTFSLTSKNGNDALKIVSEDDRSIDADGYRVGTVWFDGETWYWNSNGDEFESETAPTLDYRETELSLDYDDDYFMVGDLAIHTDFDKFGELQRENEGDDLMYGDTELGNVDHDLLFNNGMILRNPEHAADVEKVELTVPSDKPRVTLTFSLK